MSPRSDGETKSNLSKTANDCSISQIWSIRSKSKSWALGQHQNDPAISNHVRKERNEDLELTCEQDDRCYRESKRALPTIRGWAWRSSSFWKRIDSPDILLSRRTKANRSEDSAVHRGCSPRSSRTQPTFFLLWFWFELREKINGEKVTDDEREKDREGYKGILYHMSILDFALLCWHVSRKDRL